MAADPGAQTGASSPEDERYVKAQRFYAQLYLKTYTMHFKNPGYTRDHTMDMIDNRVCKENLRLTAQHKRVRLIIGTDPRFWPELLALLRSAIPSIERRSFSVWDPSQVDYESTSSVLIATHYPMLWKDLDRLVDSISIARNVITCSTQAQDSAAECLIEDEIYRLINCCVRVTARGYDGDVGTGDEEKWQWIVGCYKKLLIVSLQFMNNLVAQNERRKLMLWVSLFDGFPYADTSGSQDVHGRSDPALVMPEPPVSTGDILVALGETSQPRVDAAADALRAKRLLAPRGQPRPSRPVSGYVLFVKEHTAEVKKQLGASAAPTELAMELSQRWAREPEEVRRDFSLRYDELMARYDKELEQYNEARKTKVAEKSQIDQVAIRIATIEAQLNQSMKKDVPHVAPLDLPLVTNPDLEHVPGSPDQMFASSGDYNMHISAEQGTRILSDGKSELLKRLHNNEPEPLHVEHALVERPPSPPPNDVDDALPPVEAGADARVPISEPSGAQDPADPDSDRSESEDEGYSSTNEDGRGLLTDVPLILGPSEIEVLPMIIMSGIVPPPKLPIDHQQDYDAVVNMHTVRCHLLLAQDNGKNLLRELLIFVAAWDLRDEELYFKFMLKIMEAILLNGLMPYAYHAFRDRSSSKDIISPAQAVIMKLLTNIFRQRAETARLTQGTPEARPYPAPVDVHIVTFIFAEFRQHIIPQTCALIFLQGKIHQDLADPEAFPLNLWDMERMYEGVYQYLEFFAVLTEEQTWKDVMADWEVSSELVTMLRELEVAIPKSNSNNAPSPCTQRSSIEIAPPTGHLVQHPPPNQSNLPDPPPVPAQDPSSSPGEPDVVVYPDEPQDEPSDFEWRNLKKLTVLVLSSLIWKNKTVQDQVRSYGGLEALVGCCQHDEHNPYIREHAIMCLRFAVEGNPENAEVIRKMAGPGAGPRAGPCAGAGAVEPMSTARSVGENVEVVSLPSSDEACPPVEVPKEVLDTQCYETFMDKQGQVGLRRKQAQAQAQAQMQMQLQCQSQVHAQAQTQVSAHTQPFQFVSAAQARYAAIDPNLDELAKVEKAVTGAISDLQLAASIGGRGASAGTGATAGAGTAASPSASSPSAHNMTTKMAAERAAEIMQTALRDLPLPAAFDRDNRDIIARLNRTALELSEALGGEGSEV